MPQVTYVINWYVCGENKHVIIIILLSVILYTKATWLKKNDLKRLIFPERSRSSNIKFPINKVAVRCYKKGLIFCVRSSKIAYSYSSIHSLFGTLWGNEKTATNHTATFRVTSKEYVCRHAPERAEVVIGTRWQTYDIVPKNVLCNQEGACWKKLWSLMTCINKYCTNYLVPT